jgi:hypothetical protein
MEKINAIPTWQFKDAHLYVGAKCNTHIMTLYGGGKCNTFIIIQKWTLYVGGKMYYWHYDPKSTLSMGGQNAKSIYQEWNIFNGIWWPY